MPALQLRLSSEGRRGGLSDGAEVKAVVPCVEDAWQKGGVCRLATMVVGKRPSRYVMSTL